MFNKILAYFAYRYQRWSVERDPMSEIRRNYVPRFGKEPNLETPKNLIEKIYWMQLHCDTSLWTQCADKYRMRDYVIAVVNNICLNYTVFGIIQMRLFGKICHYNLLSKRIMVARRFWL